MRRHQCRPDPLTPARRRRSARGLTLVELMMSAALGILLLTAAVAVLLAAGRMRRNQQLLSDANDEARAALRVVSRALAATGVGGSVYAYLDDVGNKQQRAALIFTNGAAPLSAPDMPQAPDTITLLRYAADRRSELVENLVGPLLRLTPDPRLSTTPGVIPDIFQAGESALVTNFQRAMLLPVSKHELNGPARTVDVETGLVNPVLLQDAQIPIEPGSSVFPVQVVRYRVLHVPAAGNQPERGDLVMETLNPRTLAVLDQSVLARDVEDFQVQWAYDRNDDGVADGGYSDDGPTGTAIDPGLTFARVSISARTSAQLVSDKGPFEAKGEMTPFERGLDLGGAEQPPPSGYRRRVLSTVVLLKNLAAPRI
ncbi:hypothetical protein [Melittangium boletus]|nr:hypothetical protein [Melittangium boletus]